MKKWWKSKTVLFNLAMTILAASEAAFPVIQPILPVSVHGIILFALTVGNVALRFISTQTIVDRRKKDDQVTMERRK